jgi:hypothetical protein
MPTTMTREQWLNKIVTQARPMFKAAGKPLLKNVRVAIAPPRGRGNSIGTCWSSECSKDGGCEIWVSAELNDPMRIADTLVHELCHAALPTGTGHKKPFADLATAMLLEGKPTATVASAEFKRVWKPILKKIGKYPGVAFSAPTGAKQGTRLIKAECDCCGFVFRTTQKWIDQSGEYMRGPSADCDGDMQIG